MGEIDRSDQNIANSRITIRIKKWWRALFVWIPDVIVQNACLLYRINKDEVDPKLDLLAFRRKIVNVYLRKFIWTNIASKTVCQ